MAPETATHLTAIAPSANGAIGRDAVSGRFLPGNVGGPGNPHARQVASLRSALLEAVSADDLRSIVTRLVELARSGSVPAAKEVLDRCLGRPPDWESIERRDLARPTIVYQGIRLEVAEGSGGVGAAPGRSDANESS